MVLAKENDNLVYGLKLSSVGAGQVAGQNMLHDPSSLDLAMKLHYLRGLYFFTSQAAEGLEVTKIKEAMFDWLCTHYRALGRFRRSESSGRPYLKCNDCGARFIEAQSEKTVEECMGMDWSLQKQLVSNQIIGPELFFSPVVLFQLTRFKCGGVSLGLSWAHVLGDAMAATDFINGLSRVMDSKEAPRQPYSSKIQAQKLQHPSPLLALKKVGSVGDHWITPNNHKMETFSFSITPTQLNNLKLKLSGQNPDEKIPIFELVCGLMWHCVAKVRQGSEPKVVTVCRNDTPKRARGECSNSQVISTVETAEVADTDPKELAALLAKCDESYEQSHIEEEVDKDNGVSDFVVYGGNLTFVNWEDVEFYGFEVDGHTAVSVNYNIQGVGDEGAVLVLPGPSGEGRVVNVTLPEKEVLELKAELRKNDLLQED